MHASGTSGATAQDLTMRVEPLGPDGKSAGVMELRMTGTRTGDCKPGDVTPPTGKAS